MKWSTFLKWAAPIGAAVAAPFTFGGSLLGLGAGGGAAAALGDIAGVASSSLAAGGTAAAGGLFSGLSGASLLGLGGIGANLATNIYSNHAASSATDRSTQAQITAAKYAADQDAAGQAAQLKFLQEQEAARQEEQKRTEALNLSEYNRDSAQQLDMYNQGNEIGIDQYNRREASRTPYRNLGEGAAGTLGSLLGIDPALMKRAYVPQAYNPIAFSPAGGDSASGGALSAEEQAALAEAANGVAPTSAGLNDIIAKLKAKGLTAVRARHANNTLDSDDKLIINGKMKDLIYNVGGADARFTL